MKPAVLFQKERVSASPRSEPYHQRGPAWWSLALAFLSLTLSAYCQTPDLFNPGVDGFVRAMAVQLDGRIIVGGRFTNLAGQACSYLGRLEADGTLDRTLFSGTDDEVYTLLVQADGKILAGGRFANLGGQTRYRLGRLNPDGSADPEFNPGANGDVVCLAEQPDGKILVTGGFTFLGGQPCSRIGRLNADGSLDTSFHPTCDGWVESLAVQLDGKVVVGGSFTNLSGGIRRNIGRLNPDGTLDAGFNSGTDQPVSVVAVRADGKIVICGWFSTLSGVSCPRIGRLNADGSLDTAFAPGVNSAVPFAVVLQADGRLVVGGNFTQLGGQACNRLGRLNPDGMLDTGFSAGASSSVDRLALQGDGKILVAGSFTNLAGQPRNRMARLINTDAPADTLGFDGSTVTWQRGGAGPEVWRVTFEASTNGTDWFLLGDGERVSGRWQRAVVGLPANATIRGRGFAVGATYQAGSSWVIEQLAGPPAISLQPADQTLNAGETAVLRVVAGGNGALEYQWFKGGIALEDSQAVSGVHASTLRLSNVLGPDAGPYSVVITTAGGALTSRLALLTVRDPCITLQPISQSALPAQSASFNVAAAGTPPLSFQWRRSGVSIPGETSTSLLLTNLQRADAVNYDVVVSNSLACVTSSLCALTVNQAYDDYYSLGTDDYVEALALQPDGKALVGGAFSTLGGQPHALLGRLNVNGSPDTAFSATSGQTLANSVKCFAVHPDGFIVVGGSFTSLNYAYWTNLGRVYLDGSLDPKWRPLPDKPVLCAAIQPDGKFLVGGQFTQFAGQTRSRLVRVNADGTVDATFDAGAAGGDSTGIPAVEVLVIQPDRRILVGGWFTNLCGQTRWCLGRLNVDGTLDAAFNPDVHGGTVKCLALQPDGKILVGGQFTFIGAQPRYGLGRLNADGSLDSSFTARANSWGVMSLALQTDGKILVGGGFTNVLDQARNYIERLNPDGSLDTTFDPGYDGWVYALAVQRDGKVLAGGQFKTVAGMARNYLDRLISTDPATQSLTFDGGTITWLREGTSPEVAYTTFEYSTNGTDLAGAGPVQRIAGGWQVTGLNLPTNTTIRVRGIFETKSCWYEERILGQPFVAGQPTNLIVNYGWQATLTVAATGTPPFSYQWLKDGVGLSNGGNISGANTATLTVNNAWGADSGGYSVVVSNLSGCITSRVAALKVLDPYISSPPISRVGNLGQNITFAATILGTQPLSYQWRKDGSPIPGATGSSFTVTNVQAESQGDYDLCLSNRFDTITSAAARLIVNQAIPDAFNPGANNSVYAFAEQPDGKILVGGAFGSIAGQVRSCLGRLTAGGSLDAAVPAVTGSPPLASGGPDVSCLALQPDGKILVGGTFASLGGQARTNLARLNPDGSLDTAFNPNPDSSVRCLAVQEDGKILVGGRFVKLAGQMRFCLGRLNPDGSLDATFNPSLSGGPLGTVYSLTVQPDGRILVGGSFTAISGRARNYFGRLTSSGMVDTFNPGPSGVVLCSVVQPDGKILVGGAFTNLAGMSCLRLGRLNTNGTLDTSFNPGASSSVFSLVFQADGSLLVGGSFTNLAGQARSGLGRFNPDGTLDQTFVPQTAAATSTGISALDLQPNGKVLVGGYFTTLAGQTRSYLGRLLNTTPATETLDVDGSDITWLRGGASPEVWRATFDYSTNGTNWWSLGTGVRIPGGWVLRGASVRPGAAVRARGLVTGGRYNGSSWFAQSTRPAVTVDGLDSGQFKIHAIGSPGQVLVFEASSDLHTWIPVATNTLATGPVDLGDSSLTNSPARFYRARECP